MLSQTFCYWDKQQCSNSNIIQFHLTLKCTKDQSSHFCDYFLASNWMFQHHEHGLTKCHAGSQQPLVCVVVNTSSYPAVKSNNTAYHAFWKYWMQARAGVANFFCTADRFKAGIFSRTGFKKNTNVQQLIFITTHKLLQLWLNENLELVFPQRDAPT